MRLLQGPSTAVVLIGLLPGIAAAQTVIGVADSFSGPLAWSAEQAKQGAAMAVHDLNAAGGVLGRTLMLSYADDACDEAQAIAAAEKLHADGAVLVVGHGCSGASIRASRVYEEAGIIQISASSTNPALTEAGRRNVFRVIGRDDRQGSLAGDLLADRWPDARIAIVHDGQRYGLGLAEATRAQLHRRGVQEAMFEAIVPNAADYTPAIGRMLANGITVIYAGLYHNDAGLLIRQTRGLGLAAQLVAGNALMTDEFIVIAGPAGEGTLITFSPDPRRIPAAVRVVERFRAEGFEPDGYTLFAYAAVQAWAQAAAAAGTTAAGPVGDALRTHLFSMVIGDIGFDAKGDPIGADWIWYIWRNGVYVPVN